MRRAVVLLAAGLILSACSSTVEGRGRTESPRPVPRTSATAPTDPDRTTTDDSTPAFTTEPTPTTATPTTATPTQATPIPATPTEPATDPPPSAEPVPSTLQLPTGFYAAAGGDLAYRPMSTDEFDCTPDQLSGCFGIMVFSAPGCASGAGVTVEIFDKARDPDHPIGSATGTTPPILPGGSQFVVIADSTGVVANLTARVQQVVC